MPSSLGSMVYRVYWVYRVFRTYGVYVVYGVYHSVELEMPLLEESHDLGFRALHF